MPKPFYSCIITRFIWICCIFHGLEGENIYAQAISFSHINASMGLSGNNVTCVTTDKNGLLWIGTAEGLNIYDGYKVGLFGSVTHPQLYSGFINALLCDSRNRIWVGTSEGLSCIDTNRVINEITFPGSDFVLNIFSLSTNDIIVFTKKGFYKIKAGANPTISSSWVLLKWITVQEVMGKENSTIRDIVQLGNNKYLFFVTDNTFIIDFTNEKKLLNLVIPDGCSGCSINDTTILVGTQAGKLFKINTVNNKISKEYVPVPEEQKVHLSNIVKLRTLLPGTVIITSYFGGYYILNLSSDKLVQHKHDPLNELSIGENRTGNIFYESNGYLFVTSINSGLNVSNLNNYKVSSIPVFADEGRNLFDGYINDIAEGKQNDLWLAAFDKIIYWNRQTNAIKFMPYYKYVNSTGKTALEIKSICRDSLGKIWVSIYDEGIAILNQATGQYKIVTHRDSSGNVSALASAYIHDLFADSKGKIWACSGTGVFKIDAVTMAIDTLLNDPLLKSLAGKRIFKIWCDNKNRFWLASDGAGVFCYDQHNVTLKNYTQADGLASNTCYCFTEDSMGNIYFATAGGLTVLKTDGSIKKFDEKDGIRSGACNGLLTDAAGHIWLLNRNNLLVRFDPENNTFKYFGSEAGFSIYGYRRNSFLKAANGEFFWGSNRGLSFFYPERFDTAVSSFRLSVQKLLLADTTYLFSNTEAIDLSYAQNSVNFYFTAINLSGSKNIYYQYMLQGYDNTWVKGIDITSAKYNSLAAGNYTFLVRASEDGVNWISSSNLVHLHISGPFWKTWWFITGSLLLIAISIYYYTARRIKMREERELLKLNYQKQMAAMEMKTLRAQMNPHFIFNSLNSIDTFILKNESDNASDYLDKFSRLVRLILDNSRSEWVLLESELKALELYIELESVRFENVFTYVISVDPSVAASSVVVPPLIIQPYVENAIWHGLMHRKMPGGQISITISKNKDNLQIEVLDNGVGREVATKLKGKKNELHKSHGMQITAERLSVVNDIYHVNAGVNVTDLYNENNESTGTKVVVTINYKTNADYNH